MKIIDPPVAGYIGGLGRFMHRTKEPHELARLDEIVEEVSRVIAQKRIGIAKDPLSVTPARLMDIILENVPAIHEVTSPIPVVVQMDSQDRFRMIIYREIGRSRLRPGSNCRCL